MRPIIIALPLIGLGTLVSAQALTAAAFAIAVGQEGRGYERRGLEIAQLLAERDVTAEVVNYAGSDAISRAVCAGDAQVGIMQEDAIYTRGLADCEMEVVAVYGEEMAFMLVPPDSDIDGLSDLTGESKVLTDQEGSGTDLFWHTILQIEETYGSGNAWTGATQVYGGTARAAALAEANRIDAVILVGNPQSEEVMDLVAKGWELGDIRDKDINDLEVNGDTLYEVEEINIDPPGWFDGQSGSGYEVESFIMANMDWMRENAEAFNDLVAAAN